MWGTVNNGDLFERISANPSADDEVIFVKQSGDGACGTTQNTNNRNRVSITTSSNQYIYDSSDAVQVFVVKTNASGQFGFHTGGGYIYSASSSSNNLKTNSTAAGTAPSGTSAWTLAFSSSVLSATNVTNTSYYLAFNTSSALFSQYKSAQSKPYLYKKVMSAPTAVAASSITSSGATITITDATNVNNYELYYSKSSTAPNAGTTASTTITSGKSKALTGLDASSTYYLWARAYSTSPARKTGWVALTGTTFTTEASGCTNTITISKGSESHGTFTLNKSGSQMTCDGLSIIVTPSAADHYHVGSVSASTGETGVDNGNGTWTVTYAANVTGASTINVVFAEDTKYTLNYHDGSGNGSRSNIYEGTNLITALGSPAASCDPTSTTYVGWSTTEITTKTDTKPTFVAADAVVNSTTAAATYYAVYAKVNSGNWSITSIDQLSSGSGYATYNGSHTAGGISYTSYQVMQNSGIQFQSSAGYLYNTTAMSYDITSIVIGSSSTNWSVYTSSSTINSTPGSGAITISSDGNTHTFTVSATGHTYFHIKGGASTPKATSITVNYETVKDYITTCASCSSAPTVETPSLDGSFSLNNVPLTCTADPTTGCSISASGFVWKAGSAPSSSDNSTAGTYDAGAITGTIPSAGTFAADGTTYYIKAWATNSQGTTYSSSSFLLTPRSVTFDLNDHGSSTPSTQYVNNGGKATDPSYSESVAGWTFGGWYDNEDCTGSAWNFSSNTVSGANVTLYAKWTEKPKYTITLNAGNGTVSAAGWTAGVSPTWSKTQANGDEEITLPSASCNCAGWEFQGWAASSVDQAGEPTMTSSGTSVLPGSNTTYYAVYRENSTGGTTYNKITNTGDLTTGDYLFVADGGYAMQNTVNGKRMDEVSGFTSSNPSQTTDNTSLVWTIAKFNSQVVIKNGSNYLGIDADNTICMTTTPHFFIYSYNAGSSRWEFTSVTKTSYQLTYSTAAGTSYSYFCAGTSQSTAIYLYKQGDGLTGNYKTNPSCLDITVTGVVSPAGSGIVTLTAGSGKSGDKVYAMYTPDEDYNFNNWTISGTGSTLGSTSAVVTEITIGSENTTVTANFVAKDWKTVTWKSNGVALTGEDLGSASVKVENGFNITALPPAPASCDDASTTFMGWVEDGEVWSGPTDDVSGVTIYEDVSDFPTVTANVTYHAVWARRNGSAAPATYAGTGVFTKITTLEELEVGAHYVLYGTKDDDASVKGAMNNTFTVEASGKNVFGASAVTISNNKITNPDATIVWKLGGTTNAYTLYSQNSSKYVEITANDTRGYTNPAVATTSFTITVSEGNFKIITNYASASSRMITIYTASVFRSYSYLTEGYTLNLYKYGNDYTYDKYLVKCCEDPELAFDGEYNYQTLVRQDIHGARGGNGSATAEQGKATLVLDYSTESGGTCTVEVKKLTGGDNRSAAAAGSSCANHTGIAINESTKKVTFDVWTYAGSYPTANGQGTYRIKIMQEATSTYCAAETYYFVDVTLRDKFVDAVNGNATINVDGQSKTTSDYSKTPTESSLDADKNDDCHSTTRRFLGWVREDNMDTWYGSSSDRTRDLDDKKDDAALVAPNADIITTGSTWYAVWGIEE